MIYNLIDLIYLDFLIIFNFLIFCLCDFINNCKSENNSVVKHSKISSQFSPDGKSPFELTPETTSVEVQEGNSRKIEVGDLS